MRTDITSMFLLGCGAVDEEGCRSCLQSRPDARLAGLEEEASILRISLGASVFFTFRPRRR